MNSFERSAAEDRPADVVPQLPRYEFANRLGKPALPRALESARCAGLDFRWAKAFRMPPAYRGQRNFPGWWRSVTTRSHVVYESWLERRYLIEADGSTRPAQLGRSPR